MCLISRAGDFASVRERFQGTAARPRAAVTGSCLQEAATSRGGWTPPSLGAKSRFFSSDAVFGLPKGNTCVMDCGGDLLWVLLVDGCRLEA
jgi:hypothetical protein